MEWDRVLSFPGSELLNDVLAWYSSKPLVYTLGIVVIGLITHRILTWMFLEESSLNTAGENVDEILFSDMVLPMRCLKYRAINLSGKWHTSVSAVINPPKLSNWRPLLVFANRKSGSYQGGDILDQCLKLLSPIQVHDLSSKPPHATLEICRLLPDTTFLIMVCGGDGSVNWVLSAIDQLDLKTQPLVTVLPLGTGNDLSIMLGWGACFDTTDTVEHVLTQLRYAQPISVDRWKISIHPHRSYLGWRKRSKIVSMINYFSIGCDAVLALNFHRQRQKKPSLFTKRSLNKLFYFGYGAIDVLDQQCKDLNKSIQVSLDGERIDLPDIEGVLFLNISSWGGGCHVWDNFSDGDMNWNNCDPGDGLVEVIGFTSSFHMAQIQLNLAEPIRIGQAKKVNILVTNKVPAQIDGEPWEQEPCHIELQFQDQALLLKKEMDDISESSEILQLETN